MREVFNNNGLLVRYHVYSNKTEDYEYVGAYRTDKMEETIKALTFAMKNEIEVGFNDYETSLHLDKIKDLLYGIDDLQIILPSDTSVMALEVYLR